MSAALHSRADSSGQSGLTLQDLSLGSLPSFSTPAKYRVPSTSSGTTAPSSNPLSTPSPGASLSRRRTDDASASVGRQLRFSKQTNDEDDEDNDGDVLETPGRDRNGEIMGTPLPNRMSSKRKSGPGSKGSSNLTLRDQEKHIDSLKKENFNIKLKVHFLEERLAQLAPDQIDAALKQNINLKIEVQQRGLEMKKYKKLVLELERELERTQRGRGRERELEERLEDMEREMLELRRQKGGVGTSDEKLIKENEQLKQKVEEARQAITGNAVLMDDMANELDLLRKGVSAGNDESDVSRRRSRLEARIAELEDEREKLLIQLDEFGEILSHRDDERDNMLDQIEGLQLKLEDLEQRRQSEMLDRSESRAQILEEREEREAIEDDLNALRDKLAAAAIEIGQKDDEIEVKMRDIEEMEAEHARDLQAVEEDWRGEVEEARNQVDELRDVLAERDADSKELRLHISELEANTADLHDKFETALTHLENEAEEKDAEIESANREIQKLGQRVYELEDELDNLRAESDKMRENEGAERDRLEALAAALKDKIAQYKAELQDTNELYEQANQEAQSHRARQEELAQHVEDLIEEMRRERDARQKAEFELDAQANEHDAALRAERRTLDAKEGSLQSALTELARAQALLTQREADLADVQAVLREQEAEARKRGESATTDRFSLQLEVDRLRRDGDRLEEELSRARAELSAREAKLRERDDAVDRLHGENRELTTQLAGQTQARLNMIEKLDMSQGSLRTAEAELAACRSRLTELETRLSKDQRSLFNNEKTHQEQVHERNQLLLNVYSYLDRILGVDKSPKKPESKPYTNFNLFHELLMNRLKALGQVNAEFERKSKEMETRYSDKLGELRKQLDIKWKQIDKFEASIKNLTEIKFSWKRKFSLKEGEIEALKATNSELTSQLSSSRRPGQSESLEIKSLQARAANAERRLTNAQNQLAAAEEKVAAMNQKTTVADGKWEARVKEYEARIRSAEERVKRERQGAKERVAELETNIKSLHRQMDLASRRNSQLNEVIESNKIPSSPRTSSPRT